MKSSSSIAPWMLVALCFALGCGDSHELADASEAYDPEWVPEPGSVRIDSVEPEPATPAEQVVLRGSFPGDGTRTWVSFLHEGADILSFSNTEILTVVPPEEAVGRATTVVVSVRGVEGTYLLDLVREEPEWPDSGGGSTGPLPEKVVPGQVIFIRHQPHWGVPTGFEFDGVPSPEFAAASIGYQVEVPAELTPGTVVTVTVILESSEETVGTTEVVAG